MIASPAPLRLTSRTALVCFVLALATDVRAQSTFFPELDREFSATTLPLLKTFCLDCHSTADKQGELDLQRFRSLTDIRRDPPAWQKVAEMLDNGEMPPKDSPKPSADQRKQLRTWVQRYLDAEATASAGDPGLVPLRRLTNAEYTYTIQDLTGVPLTPAREFPADGAAGEGFSNAGAALSMSPALIQKYLDAGKDVASHMVLLPAGVRFSPNASRRDWTEEALAEIRRIYARDTAVTGASQVNLQGIVFETNGGGRLPVEKYLAATLEEREALRSGKKTVADVASERSINAKYLGLLWDALNRAPAAGQESTLLDGLRANWNAARRDGAAALTSEISQWQRGLFRFATIGHIGKVGGPKAWMEPISPLAARQEVRSPIDSAKSREAGVTLFVNDAGDGSDGDFVVWERPRLVAAGRPEILLRDLPMVAARLASGRERLLSQAADCLAAADEASRMETVDIPALAARHHVEAETLAAWLEYLGIGTAAPLGDLITGQIKSVSNYDFVQGWTGENALSVLANSSNQDVRIPGNLSAHGIVVHPTPTRQVCIGWKAPAAASVQISARVQHAHPECGNGVAWSLEVRRGSSVQRLGAGFSQGATPIPVGPFHENAVRVGDIVVLLIGPRDGNHSCDTTSIDLTIKSATADWNLAADVSPDILAANPHADRQGNAGVWNFFSEPTSPQSGRIIPSGSLLARWQTTSSFDDRRQLATALTELLKTEAGQAQSNSPDELLYRQLISLNGPAGSALRRILSAPPPAGESGATISNIGVDPNLFGKHPNGTAIEPTSLCVQAPSELKIAIPPELAEGAEFVATCSLHPATGRNGSVQVGAARPGKTVDGLRIVPATDTVKTATWTSAQPASSSSSPILTTEDGPARKRFEAAFDDFRKLFPPALCYTKIVPVDEAVTLTLYHREDEPLCRLMLSDAETAHLNAAWDELHFISQDALTLVDAFKQILEFASQDADPKVFEPMRKPIMDRAEAYRRQLVESEPSHLTAVLEFASRAWRRPLTDRDTAELRTLCQRLRQEELPHEDAIRFVLARVFVAPDFLYRLESAPAGSSSAPVNDHELAARLSYFLWSSLPDAELRHLADEGRLHEPEVLTAQTRRMLKDPKVRRLATEFACQWLHVYDFDQLDEKSERHFPEFKELKRDMYEEVIRSFTHLFQTNGSILSIYDANSTVINGRLARFYGLKDVAGDEWRPVTASTLPGRGGVFGFAATLAKQSGASRTSPILRGNWVSEVLLGERLPRPPKNVPQLPEEEGAENLTVRQLVEKHSSDAACAHCHTRIDPFGFALEGFDAIGRARTKDLAGHAIDTSTRLADGTPLEGADGLKTYLLNQRRDALLRQFCKKLLGYSLGRGVQLSDEPLLREMQVRLTKNDFRFAVAVETIVESRQFREIRPHAE